MTMHEKLTQAANLLGEVVDLMGKPGFREIACAKSVLDQVLANWGKLFPGFSYSSAHAYLNAAQNHIRNAMMEHDEFVVMADVGFDEGNHCR